MTRLVQTAQQEVTLGHKGGVDEFRKDLQLTRIESSTYWLCHENENVPHRSSERCWAGLDFLSIFPENDDKIASLHLSPDH
jgi:hypothetical protein